MKKTYSSRRVPLVAVPIFGLLPLGGAILRGYVDMAALVETALCLLLALSLFLYARRCVARIEGGMLRFFSGIGQAEMDRIDLSSISSVERIRPWFLTIRFGDGKSLSLEADKAVVSELAKDLAIFVGKKSLPQS